MASTATGAAEVDTQPKPKRQVPVVVKAYLLVYNGVLTAGWTLLLMRTVQFVVSHWADLLEGLAGDEEKLKMTELHAMIQWPLQVFQSAAILEIVHAMIGIVPSGVATTAMQVASRIFVTWPIMEGVAGTTQSPGVILVATAWSISEVVRYAYYFFSLVDAVPYVILWCRYTFFTFLYPIGVLGEQLLLFKSLPVVRATEQWSVALPNKLNISYSFYYHVWITILLYIPLYMYWAKITVRESFFSVFPQLYGHMLRQRRKMLGGEKGEAKKDK